MWAWGSRDQGECGTGSEPPPEEAKKPLLEPKATDATALQGQIVAVAAGEGHSLALDNLGNVYAWGRTREGQAGRVSREPQHAPLLVQSLSHEIVTSVACGASSCFAVAASGQCYTWGSVLQRSGGRLHHDAAGYGRSFSELSEATQRMLKLSVRPRIACSDWPWPLVLTPSPDTHPNPSPEPNPTSPLVPTVTPNPNQVSDYITCTDASSRRNGPSEAVEAGEPQPQEQPLQAPQQQTQQQTQQQQTQQQQ